MNKTVIFITFAVVVLIGVIGLILLQVFRPDASASFISSLILLLGLLSTAAGQFYMLGKIERQTNGNLTAEKTHNAALTTQLVDAGIPPVAPPAAAEVAD